MFHAHDIDASGELDEQEVANVSVACGSCGTIPSQSMCCTFCSFDAVTRIVDRHYGISLTHSRRMKKSEPLTLAAQHCLLLR